MIEVSAGVIYNEEGRILVCRRGEGRANAHLWEFPGGKREEGESAADCLVRELMEELHLPVTQVREDTVIPHGSIRFTFLTGQTAALPVLTEHEDARFVTPREMLHMDFCPADVMMTRLLAFRQVRHAFWDFDGTLLDSYPAMVRAFVAAAADYGVAISPERTLALMKNCLTHCCRVVGEEKGIDPGELVRAFRRHEQAELEKGLPPVAGIPEALAALHACGVKHYVATHRDLQCRELLEKAGLLLHLIVRHGLAPAACMMVGDRPLDTESGMAAGVLSVLLDPEDRFPEGACDLRIPAPWLLTNYIT